MSKTIDNAKEAVTREGIKATKMNGVVIVDDGSNQCTIPGFPYKFKAQGDKLLVSVDVFKSGYECKTCRGECKIHQHCDCEEHDRPGFKYSKAMLENAPADLGEARSQILCPSCSGNFMEKRKEITCPDCNGKGALLHFADQAKLLPTTGVIVSLGETVIWKREIKLFLKKILPRFIHKHFTGLGNDSLYIHNRVLFGAYSGTMIPTRAPGVVFKVIRDIEVLLIIEGGEELAAFDFITVDQNA